MISQWSRYSPTLDREMTRYELGGYWCEVPLYQGRKAREVRAAAADALTAAYRRKAPLGQVEVQFDDED